MAAFEVCNFGLRCLQVPSIHLLAPCLNTAVNLQFVRYRRAKHWNPKFKKLRKLKVMKVDLPKYDKKQEDATEEEIRSKMKELGLQPPRFWKERVIDLSCTAEIHEPYVPPEGDGKLSLISKPGALQTKEVVQKKVVTLMSIRRIRTYEEDFTTREFAVEAQEIYIAAHNYLISKDKLKLRQVVTERLYPEMMHNIRDKTIHWKFVKSLEPPRVVHVRCTYTVSKENVYAQVTVRFHTQQVLAVYDRFGRLMHGSEIVAKDVLEYVVFEKHLPNEHGVWRIHDKIIPDWVPRREPGLKTYRKPEEPPAEPEDRPAKVSELQASDTVPTTAAVA